MADILEDQVKKAKEREAELRALKGELTPEELASYEAEYKAVPGQREALKQGYDKSSDRKDWAELADLIAQNVAKIGAAKQGLDQNVDLSKLDIKGYDWDKSRDRDLKRYSTELEPLEKREQSLAGLIALGAKKPKDDKLALDEAMGVQEKGTGLPAYLIKGQTGYYNAFGKPIEVEKYKKEKQEKEASPYLDIAKENQLSRAQQDFASLTKKNRETAEAVGEAKTLLIDAATNPAAFAALSAKMPRVMGEVGNLTETEQKRYSSGGKSVQDRMAQIYSDITKGTITPDNQKYLQDVLAAMEEANKRNLSDKTAKFVGGRSKILKLQPQELEGYLGVDSSAAAPDKKVVKKQFSKTANKTKLIYSDGTEEIVDGQQ